MKFYDWSKISDYYAIDNSNGMLQLAKDRLHYLQSVNILANAQVEKFKNHIILNDAENLDDLPNSGKHYDTVIDTFSMCVFEKPSTVLEKMKKVLNPNGR